MALNRGGVQILEQFGKMAQLRMNYSCPQRQFILALRSGKTCCAVCGSQTTDIFSQVGLQQHYRIRHRGTEFDDNALKDGVKCLRKFAANETKENLIALSEQRKNSVGTIFFGFIL
jgi:hypothetical protein